MKAQMALHFTFSFFHILLLPPLSTPSPTTTTTTTVEAATGDTEDHGKYSLNA